MDCYTFGNSPVHVTMSKILSELNNKKITSKVSVVFNRVAKVFKELEFVNNDTVFKNMCFLVLEDAKKHCKNMDIPCFVKSHLINMIMVEYREALRKRDDIQDNLKHTKLSLAYENIPTGWRRIWFDNNVMKGDMVWNKSIGKFEDVCELEIGKKVRDIKSMVIRFKTQ